MTTSDDCPEDLADIENLGTGNSSLEANQYIQNDMMFSTPPPARNFNHNSSICEQDSKPRLKHLPLNRTLLKSHEVAVMDRNSSAITKMTTYLREVIVAEGTYFD
jgi:hypothetical protein